MNDTRRILLAITAERIVKIRRKLAQAINKGLDFDTIGPLQKRYFARCQEWNFERGWPKERM